VAKLVPIPRKTDGFCDSEKENTVEGKSR